VLLGSDGAGEYRFGAGELGLERSRIDAEQNVAFFDPRALVHQPFEDQPAHLRPDFNPSPGCDATRQLIAQHQAFRLHRRHGQLDGSIGRGLIHLGLSAHRRDQHGQEDQR
jgi:hypothetical protein